MLPAPLLLRPALDSDGPALARLIAGCFAEYEGCLYEAAEFPELEAPARHYAARGGRLWVATHDEDLVASLCIVPVAAHQSGELSKVYLAAPWRGRGIAQALMAQAESFAMQAGLARLALWTDTRFHRAHRFYEKHGFARQPVLRFLPDVSDSWEYRYERSLAGGGMGSP